MIRAAILLALAVGFAPAESSAQIPDISATPHQLRTMTPPQLGALLFNAESPPFADSWVEGPTLQWSAISVMLATIPASTGYGGLCSLTIGAAFFRAPETRGEDVAVHLSATPWIRNAFVLTDDVPSLQPVTGDDGCAERLPYAREYVRPTVFHVTDATEDSRIDFKTSSSAETARFALAALMAARDAAKRLPVAKERCYTGYTDIPRSCGDPAAFVRTFYMRQVTWLAITRCKGAKTLCVEGVIRGLTGGGVDHVFVTTGETGFTASPTIRAITVRAGDDPIE